jgi:DNA-binding MarR family transcriptional regulator
VLWHIAQMSSMIAAGYWELDVGTGTLSLCPRSREMFGLPLHRAEPLGEKDWVRLVHPDDLPVVRRALHAHMVGERIYAERFRAIRPDGSVREIFGVGGPLNDLAERACFVGWNVDVVSSGRLAGEEIWYGLNLSKGVADLRREAKCSSSEEQTRPLLAQESADRSPEHGRLLERAEAIMRIRQARERLMGRAMLGEPAFDLFLALYILSAKQGTVSITGLAQAAGIPSASAWRWLAYLVGKGFVSRCPSAVDRRIVSVRLTESGRAIFDEFLALR